MRRIAWLSAILILIGAPAVAQQGWTRYELEDGAVSVSLPAAPNKRQSTTPEGTRMTIYTAVASADVGAVVMIAEMPGADPKAILDGAVKRQITAENLISRTDLVVDGSPAINVTARHNGSVVYDLMVFRDGRLYQFLTTAGAGKTVAPHADAYHRSVKFKAR